MVNPRIPASQIASSSSRPQESGGREKVVTLMTKRNPGPSCSNVEDLIEIMVEVRQL